MPTPVPTPAVTCDYTGAPLLPRAITRGVQRRYIYIAQYGCIPVKEEEKPLAAEASALQRRVAATVAKLNFTDEARELFQDDCDDVADAIRERKECAPDVARREKRMLRRAAARRTMRTAYCCPLTGQPVPQDAAKSGRIRYATDDARLTTQWFRRFKRILPELLPHMTAEKRERHAATWESMTGGKVQDALGNTCESPWDAPIVVAAAQYLDSLRGSERRRMAALVDPKNPPGIAVQAAEAILLVPQLLATGDEKGAELAQARACARALMGLGGEGLNGDLVPPPQDNHEAFLVLILRDFSETLRT